MRISGLSSGLDIDQIVSDLVKAQRIPLDRVYQQKIKTEWKRDAYREVNTKLLRFRNLAFDLSLQGAFLKKSATSSRTDILTATASGQAVEGKYEVKVKQLAAAARFVSEPVDSADNMPSGEFRIGLSKDSMTSIEIQAGDSLAKVAAKINSAKIGINAVVVNDQLSLTTTATGENVQIYADQAFTNLFGGELYFDPQEQIEGEDEPTVGALMQKIGDSEDYTLVKGTNAEVEINGIQASFESNTIEFSGITVKLLSADPSATVNLEIGPDVDAVVEKVKEFVNVYNELVGELNGLLREKVHRDYQPLTEEQKAALSDKEIELWEQKAKSGLLRSDSMLSSVLSEMRLALGAAVEVDGRSVTLKDIGITTGAWYEYGRLYLDEDKLREALTEDPDAVRGLFTQRGETNKETGIAARLTSALDQANRRITDTAGRASDYYDRSFLGNRIREYESRISDMEERLLRYEERQWAKFTAMEQALSQLYAQSDWLYQQLGALQGGSR